MCSLRYPYPLMASMRSGYGSESTADLEDILDVLKSIDKVEHGQEDEHQHFQMFTFPEVKYECKTSPQSVCEEEVVELSPEEFFRAPEEEPSSSTSSTTDFIGICAVCAAPARCFHYDVPSCNGCKTFFRRTIVTERAYTCARNGNCKIDCNNRTLCRFCRFNRCVAVGMNPAAIQLPSNMDAQKITRHIQKRRLELTEQSSAGPVVKVEPKTLCFNENFYERIVDGLLYVEFKADQLRWSTFSPTEVDTRNMRVEDFLTSASYFGLAEKYERATNWPLQVQYPVNFAERSKTHPRPFVTAKFWTFMDSLIVIETAKTIPAFLQLSLPDQKTLLQRGTLTNVLLIQAYFTVMSKSKTLVYPDGVTPIKFNKEPTNLEIEIFCRMLEPFYRLNLSREEYVLMKAIILFQADCPDLSPDAEPIVEKARKEYSSALLRLMQAKHGKMEGASRFASAIGIISSLHLFAQKHRQMHLLIRINLRKNAFFLKKGPIPIIDSLIFE
ncbi:hypothetical protein L596_030233 [Steinernema carpocapsae]|uniref:Nuclear receptor domain-containing protein n=1 Tax=Steinernema carpocapsae TaxID=34508 RepID=A0A4U5LS49_STECR|nr:hypothetical protein L596_030233 [Steinernema carpocapsae]